MKIKLTLITSGFVVALTSAFCAPAAMAAPIETETGSKESSFVSPTNTHRNTITSDLALELVSSKISPNFSAKVIINESSGPQVLDTKDSKKTLASLLNDHDFDVSDFRSSGDTALEDKYLLENNENLVLFKSEVSGTSEVTTLAAPEVRKDSDTLYKGEEKVETEGVDGQALKTVINTKNLAADTTINTAAKKTPADVNSSEEKLTVLKAPEPKIVLVGTKEREVIAAPVATPNAAISVGVATNVSANAGSAMISNSSAPSTAPEANGPAKPPVTGGISQLALAQVGKAYVWGAVGPDAFDCSGLVAYVFSNNGYNVPRTAHAQGLASTPVAASDIQPGDIVWTPNHIGIYIGNGKMVHASSPGTGVILDNVQPYLAQGYKIGRF